MSVPTRFLQVLCSKCVRPSTNGSYFQARQWEATKDDGNSPDYFGSLFETPDQQLEERFPMPSTGVICGLLVTTGGSIITVCVCGIMPFNTDMHACLHTCTHTCIYAFYVL